MFLFGGAGAHADILFLLDHADEFQHEFKLGVGNGGLAASPAASSSPTAAAALLIVVYQFGPMAQILVGATIVGSIETVWAGTITPPREGIIKRWTWPAGENDGSVALLKGQEMGRFKLGSTVINLFAPGKVNLVEQLESLSVTKIGQPLAVSTETFVTPDAEPAPLPAEEIEAEHDASPLVDDKKDQV